MLSSVNGTLERRESRRIVGSARAATTRKLVVVVHGRHRQPRPHRLPVTVREGC